MNQAITTIQAPVATPSGDANGAAAPDTASEASTGESPPPAGESSGAVSDAGERTEQPRDVELDVARRLEGVARREARSRKYESQLHSRMSELDEREAKLKEREASIEEFEEDPVSWALKRDRDPVAIAKRIAQPESVEAKEIRKLKEEWQKEKDEKKRREAEEEERAEQHHRHRIMRDFVSTITPDNSPYLVSMHPDPNDVPRLVSQMLHRPVNRADPESPTYLEAFKMKHGRPPNDAEIRAGLEYEARERAMGVVSTHQTRVAPASNGSPSLQPSAPSVAPGPRSMSNQHAVGSTPRGSKPLTLEEKRAAKRGELLAAMEAQEEEREE